MTEITDVAYRPGLNAPIGMDVIDFAELRSRARNRQIDLAGPQRPDFHHLIHVHADADALPHTVDFTEHVIPPGGWLWVRPGQVHQYGALTRSRGTIVIWSPGFVTIDPPPPETPVLPGEPVRNAVDLALRHLISDYADLGSMTLEAHNRSLRMLLEVLLLRLAHARSTPPASNPANGPFERFRAAVERDFTRTHRVADYAADLGYSTRTLTRATLSATGRTAKSYLDARIVLETKRMLVHSDRASADIARHLGFSTPGDFNKFFRKHDGRTPLTFRSQARGTPA
ncbi:helix-turn-helix domain-containing protein [Saccharopolyspora mangrovi]|uniref:AraC family transcriptional regulator n=1 Tax=Saccharopolyspora mangrovi TaxID=3082379 RepID=A0ABU6A8G9_9PSEU|nr:AraC family transcriptional regulator [Saccharopolyspora sp. S2-29]MEB3367680.1 AraC family transcriptional regulator [Saccharopolyspora sp. S2-29]